MLDQYNVRYSSIELLMYVSICFCGFIWTSFPEDGWTIRGKEGMGGEESELMNGERIWKLNKAVVCEIQKEGFGQDFVVGRVRNP